MTNFTPPEFESQSIQNFLEQYYIDQVLETYRRIQKNINKYNKTNCRLTEVWLPVSNKNNKNRGNKLKIVYVDKHGSTIEDEIQAPRNVKKYCRSLRHYIKKSFETKKIKLEVSKLSIHNLHTSLSVHCDGLDLNNRFDDRPESMQILGTRHFPVELHDTYNQGLITLKNDNDANGTVIFDQWFPYSTHILNTTPYFSSDNKTMIKFYKGEDWNRFGEKIGLATEKEFSNEDWNHLCEIVRDSDVLDRDTFFGLSIDKILFFGNSGTCNVWANKKYHTSLPNKYWSKNRINLQFETYRV